VEIGHDELEWDTRESSSRTDIEEFLVFSLEISYHIRSIERINKMLENNPLTISDSREIGMSIVLDEEREKLLELSELNIREIESMG
jgi:hypothetical protein